MSLLRFEAVTRRYAEGRVTALDDVSFTVEAGERVAVVGTSGSGKSTLLHLAGVLDHPSRGWVHLDGAPVDRARADELRGRLLGFVFQRHHLIEHLTAEENVEVPMIPFEASAAARGDRVRSLLERVGLAARGAHFPAQLSGGEAQRVAIARALANGPRLLLMDEPTGELDSATGAAVMELVEELNRSAGVTILVVTHDRAVARRCTRVLSLRDGRVESDRGVRDPLLEDALEFEGSALGRLLTDDGGAEDPRLGRLGVPAELAPWLRTLRRRRREDDEG